MPVIKLSEQKDLALEVRATNLNGEDAYEASVVASFLQSLTYSTFAVSPDVSPASPLTFSPARVPDCPDWSLFVIPEAPGNLCS